MAGKSRTRYNWKILLLLFIIGGIIGGWLGEIVWMFFPGLGILGSTQSVGLSPFTLNLQVFTLTLGFMLHINFFSLLGFILAYILFRKL